MPSEVEALTKLEHQEFMGIMGQYLYESIGAQEFARRHMLTQSACVIVPSTAHISLTKAVTILGLGRESLVTVAVDEDARMDPKGLYTFMHYVPVAVEEPRTKNPTTSTKSTFTNKSLILLLTERTL